MKGGEREERGRRSGREVEVGDQNRDTDISEQWIFDSRS
jgi:hypothetical protein